MTNGEKIQKDFKGCEVCDPIVEDDIIHVIFADKNDSAIGFDWSWWNMEYNEPTTKNDLGVDCVSRADVDAVIEQMRVKLKDGRMYILAEVVQDIIRELPSVTPPLSSGLAKNSQKLEKDFGELDCISRQAVLDLIADNDLSMGQVVRGIHALPPVTPQKPRCKECKWWKDSDGEYRRGCGAESKCPINRREVFEGNGYCYLFELQESEVEE